MLQTKCSSYWLLKKQPVFMRETLEFPESQFSYGKTRELDEIISFPALICLDFKCSPVSAPTRRCQASISEKLADLLGTQDWLGAVEGWRLLRCSPEAIRPLTCLQSRTSPLHKPSSGFIYPWYTKRPVHFSTCLVS